MALFFLLGFIIVVALPSILWLYAVADVLINEFRSLMMKFFWMLFLSFFPPLGTVLYYLIGRSQRITFYPVGRVVFFCILFVPVAMIIVYILYTLGHFTLFMEPPPKAIQI